MKSIVTGFLLLLLSAGSSLFAANFTIELHPEFSGQPLQLANQQYTTTAGQSISIDLCRFYISQVHLSYEDGSMFEEADSYHLVDLSQHETLTLEFQDAPKGTIRQLIFFIGVDSLPSVSGAMGGDLDPALGMYWSWNSGYINAKLEGTCQSLNTHQNQFEYHIGGYAWPYPTLRKVKLELNQFDKSTLPLKLDLATWFDGLDLLDQPSVTMPGAQAAEMADRYANMIRVER